MEEGKIVALVHLENYTPFFATEINERIIYFTANFIKMESYKILESINISPEILDCSFEEIQKVKNVFDANKPIMQAYFDLIGGYPFAFPLSLLKELLSLDLTSEEQSQVQGLIDEFTYIYLIKDAQTGFIKIGQSRDPQFRLKTLIRQDTLLPQPNDFSLIFYWSDYPTKERELHRDFSAKRVRGEWFDLSEEEIESIKLKYAKKY